MTGQTEPDAATRLESLGPVMTELVHDLSNELSVLRGWALLARAEAEVGRLAPAELDRVVEVSGVLGGMLRDVLATVRGGAVSPEVDFDPVQVARSTLAQRVLKLSSLTVRFHAAVAGPARVRGFASFWARILANLLSNAARHARSEVFVGLRREDGDVVLRVEDDGEGISPELRQRMFEPLSAGEGGELGLGLSSVAWMVGQLGGTIGHPEHSALGGAVFEVRVPIAAPLRAPGPAVSGDIRESVRDRRVLLVDDDAGVRSTLARLLVRVGADVRPLDPATRPGGALLAAIAEAAPDLILVDLRLDRRSGLDLWHEMRRGHRSLAERTIFVSGAGPGEADWDAAGDTGQPVLAKPFDLQQLAAAIDRLPD